MYRLPWCDWICGQMLGALSQLEVSSDVWEQVLQQALDVIPDLVDEPLAAVMSFVFKAAAECQQLLHAVSPHLLSQAS